MYQNTIVVGHLGRDPEMRYTPSGDPVVNFSVATSYRYTDREGQQQEKTTWFNVSVFGKQAESCNQYLSKGRLVLVEGEVSARAYTAQDGTPRASLDLRASRVRFLGGGRGEQGEEDTLAGESFTPKPSRETGPDFLNNTRNAGGSARPKGGFGKEPIDPDSDNVPF